MKEKPSLLFQEKKLKKIKKEKMISKQIPIQFQSFSETEIQISLDKIEIKQWHGKRSIIDDFLYKHHYLGPIQGWKFCFVALYKTEIVAVAIFGRPTARLERQHDTLEITRFCLNSDLNQIKNACSFILSKILKLLMKTTTYKRVISYTDLSIHRGTIYKATNFKLVYIRKERKGKGWLNRPNRNCVFGNTSKAKFEYLF